MQILIKKRLFLKQFIFAFGGYAISPFLRNADSHASVYFSKSVIKKKALHDNTQSSEFLFSTHLGSKKETLNIFNPSYIEKSNQLSSLFLSNGKLVQKVVRVDPVLQQLEVLSFWKDQQSFLEYYQELPTPEFDLNKRGFTIVNQFQDISTHKMESLVYFTPQETCLFVLKPTPHLLAQS